MGSIQALRSEAVAMRSKEDTEVQISAYLGGVNKSLGNQITGMIDQLQSVVLERTKAYNQGVANVKKSLEGKNGVCDQMIISAFGSVNQLIAFFSSLTGSMWGIAQAALSLIGAILAGSSAKSALENKILADTYNYEKAISQLGFTKMDPTQISSSSGVPLSDAGTVNLVNKRDALSPRYKPLDTGWGTTPKTNGVGAYSALGYVGTIRRV